MFRRLTSKLAAKHVASRLACILKPKQLGVGVPGGCEAVIHAARNFIQSARDSSTPKVLIKLDVSNAFNTTDRSSFLRQILAHSPEIYPLLRQAYGFSSPLFFGENLMFSETGLQQGDPLASLSFSLVINSVISSIDCQFNAWYLDDGVFGGDVDEVCRNLSQVERSFALLGLHLNQSKCEVSVLGDHQDASLSAALAAVRNVMPGITETKCNKLVLLGSPMGADATDTAVSQCIKKIKLICDKV